MKSKLSGVFQTLTGCITITAAAVILCLPAGGFSQETTASQSAKPVAKKSVPAKKKPAPKKKQTASATKADAPLCATQLNVIEGCEACEALMDWLKSGGVKLKINKIETGKFKLFPTVEYSDKSSDHGEKLYEQTAQIPATLTVVSCKTVSE